MFTSILIPIDMAHPEKAPEMIAAAKKVAGETAKYVFANIIQSVPAAAEFSIPHEYFERAEGEARDTLAKLASENEITAEIVVRSGHPANDILAIGKDENVDLIIIGSHRPGLQDYFIGSTAARVVRHAQCSVLVMR